jgi:2-oxoglutarate ferredoxin oxidoreductase subunit beta
VGTKSKRGEANQFNPIDPVSLALELGASFVARAFSGDKAQLVPILKAGLAHKGFAIIDVISPCVTFNDHEGSTKSYLNPRKRLLPVVAADFVASDFVPPAAEITTAYPAGSAVSVQLHDGSTVRLRKLAEDYDTSDRQAATAEVERHRAKGEVPTGLFFVDTKSRDMHDISGTTEVPLSQVPFEKLCPGSAALDELQKSFR